MPNEVSKEASNSTNYVRVRYCAPLMQALIVQLTVKPVCLPVEASLVINRLSIACKLLLVLLC